MASGLDMYDALWNATRTLSVDSTFTLNAVEAHDLQKLMPSELISRGYGRTDAEKVSSALREGDYCPLGKSMGLKFVVSPDAPRLLRE